MDALLPDFLGAVFESLVHDVASSQLHKFVAGAGPLRPISAVGGSAAAVILLPLEQFRSGGKAVFALRKGAL